MRSCLLAMWMSETAGIDLATRETIYWVALMRYIGCTGHAHEVATLFGDEIAIRARTLVHDAANPAEVMRDVLTFATAGRPPEQHEEIIRAINEGAHAWAVHNFASGCEVGDMLLRRLNFGEDVRNALRYTFERWNGKGFPSHASGEAIPLAMRVVHLSHDMEAIGRLHSPALALKAATDRCGGTYDPALAQLFMEHGQGWFDRLARVEPWDAVLDLEPEPRRHLQGAALDNALEVAADFIDLKSPNMTGHSRRTAQLCADAGGVLGLSQEAITALRRAALVHDFGTTGIPNSIWDKPGPLTRAEFDRVELHSMLTEQMLRRSPALALLNPMACAHHEKANGAGYHKRLQSRAGDPAGNVLSAADMYVGLTSERADRPAFSAADAAAALRRQVSNGALEVQSTDAVLAAAGHVQPMAPTTPPATHPGGLSRREIEVLNLAARGLTTKQIADRLFISPKTADHHIQNVYGKIGVSTRAAASLWATQHAVVGLA